LRTVYVPELFLRPLGFDLQVHAPRLRPPLYGVAVLLGILAHGLASELRPSTVCKPPERCLYFFQARLTDAEMARSIKGGLNSSPFHRRVLSWTPTCRPT
jgi:hypothetical protein